MRYSRKKASRYGRPKSSKRMVITPKNGFATGTPLSVYQLSQIDAFDPRVVGVKIPDSNTTPSVGVMVSDDFNLSTLPNNFASCYAFQPSVASCMITAVPGTVNSWVWPASYAGNTISAKSSAIGTNYDLYRPVAHGVRISSSLSTQSATGFVHIAVYPSRTTKGTWDFPQNLANLSECMWYTRITVSSLTQTPYVIQNKFLDCTAQRYVDTGGDAGGNKVGDNPGSLTASEGRYGRVQVANEWCTILIAIEGATVGGVLTVPISAETLVHYEALPAPGGVQVGAPASIFDQNDLAAASVLAAQSDPVQQVTPTATQSAINSATSVLQATGNLLSEVGTNIAPSARAAFVNMASGAATQYIQERGAQSSNNIGRILG